MKTYFGSPKYFEIDPRSPGSVAPMLQYATHFEAQHVDHVDPNLVKELIVPLPPALYEVLAKAIAPQVLRLVKSGFV